MKKNLRRLTRVALVMSVLAGSQPGWTQSYPVRPVRFIVPTSPGGGNDIQARIIAQTLTESFRQQVVVDNRPGAAGIIGTELGVKAPPDGYTILMGNTGTIAAAKALARNLAYDPAKDLVPVVQLSATPFLLVVHPALPARSMHEFIAYAKSKAGQLNYGSSGTGQTPHLAMELFKSMAGVNLVHVPYKGTGPAITDLLGGQVQAMINTALPLLPHVRSGKLRALAVTSPKRARALPDLPTVAESGLPGYEVTIWYGVFVPLKTPSRVVTILNREINQAIQAKEFEGRISSDGAEVVGGAPAGFAKFIDLEVAKWTRVVKLSGATIE